MATHSTLNRKSPPVVGPHTHVELNQWIPDCQQLQDGNM